MWNAGLQTCWEAEKTNKNTLANYFHPLVPVTTLPAVYYHFNPGGLLIESMANYSQNTSGLHELHNGEET